MENEIKTHQPITNDGSMCVMGEQFDRFHSELTIVKNQQNLLNEKVDLKFEILTDFFKESLDRQDKSIDRIAVVAEEARRSNDLLEQNMNFKFIEFESKQLIKEQAKEIIKLTNTEKLKAWWLDENTLLSKLILLFGSVGALAIANHFNVLEQSLKLLTK